MNNAAVVRGRMSSAEDAAVEQLAERGLSASQIALRLNRHRGTINWVMVRLGLQAPRPRTFDYVRNGKPVRSFSSGEDALIQELRIEGKSLRQITDALAEQTGYRRTPSCVRVRLQMLANREERA